MEANDAALIGRVGPSATPVDASIVAPRRALLGLLFLKLPLTTLEAAGLKVEGDRAALQMLLDGIDPLPGGFNIAEP